MLLLHSKQILDEHCQDEQPLQPRSGLVNTPAILNSSNSSNSDVTSKLTSTINFQRKTIKLSSSAFLSSVSTTDTNRISQRQQKMSSDSPVTDSTAMESTAIGSTAIGSRAVNKRKISTSPTSSHPPAKQCITKPIKKITWPWYVINFSAVLVLVVMKQYLNANTISQGFAITCTGTIIFLLITTNFMLVLAQMRIIERGRYLVISGL